MAGRSGSPIVWGFLHKDVRTKTMAEPFKYNSFTNSKKNHQFDTKQPKYKDLHKYTQSTCKQTVPKLKQ